MSILSNSSKRCESVESYKHRFAKKVLVQWLRECAAEAGWDNYARLGDIGWRVNRRGPDWGIYEEYPVIPELRSGCAVTAWDEMPCVRREDTIPTFQELVSEGKQVEAIFDVAVQHKGCIAYGFEVVHSNPVSAAKAGYLGYLDVVVCSIDADWILKQVKRPSRLVYLAQY